MTRALLPLLLFVAMGVVTGTARTEDAPDSVAAVVRLDLASAVSRALEASPRVSRLSAQERSATAQWRLARSERWPQVDATAAYQRRSAVPELSLTLPGVTVPQTIDVFPSIEDNYRLRAGVQWAVFTGGRAESAVHAAALAAKATESDTRASRADVVLETKSAYWSLVTARESRRVLEDAIRALDAHLMDANNRERVGMAARNEVLAVQVERDRAELEGLRARASADLAAAHLRRLLGLPSSTEIEPVEALEAPVDAEVEVETEALVSEALARRPERAALETRAAAAEARIGVERGARLPQVAVQAGYVYANPNRDIVPAAEKWSDTWDAGVSVSVNLFDGGRRSAAVARARAEADAAGALVRELDRGIRFEVTERTLEAQTAAASVRVAERGLESARENRRVASERYREGVVASSELLDAEIALERAALARTQTLAALRLAAAGLERAVGR